MRTIDVSVIIVNYNTKNITKQCINSIVEHTRDINYEIILVDNASSDGSQALFRLDNRVVFIESDTNLGFGKANNLAYKQARGEYVFLLNSDTILLNNAIKIFFNEHSKMPADVACLGALLRAEDGITINNSYSTFPSIQFTFKQLKSIYNKFLQIKPVADDEYLNLPFEVDYVIGADLFIKDSVVRQHGLFDPDFFMYFEESEMQYRYSLSGFKSVIIKGPEIIHLEGASTLQQKKYSAKERLMFFKSMFLYMRKRYNIFYYSVFRIQSLAFIPVVLKKSNTCNLNFKILKLFITGR